MSDTITIPGYSADNRNPGVYFALDNSKANTATAARRVLIIAGMLASGTATSGIAELSLGATDAASKYGVGSQAARAVSWYRAIDTQGEVWVMGLSDDPSAVAATGSFTIAGTASASGTLSLYIGDQLVSTLVTAGDTAATVAGNVVASAQAISGLAVTMAVDGTNAGKVNVTALNKGLAGNDTLLSVSLLGTAGGQSVPAGLSVTISQMAGGTANPTALAGALASMGERVYDLVIHPYTDSGSLTALKTALASRWSPMSQLYGHAITAYRGTYGQATAFGMAQNDPHATIMPISDSASDPLRWAAELGAQVALSMRANPAIPITALALNVMPPSDAGRFTFDERNSLLHDGLSTHRIGDDGTVTIERLITTYQKNATGQPDNSYLGIETMMQATVCLQDMAAYLAQTCLGAILVADGAKISAGTKVMTAQLVGKQCVARYRWQAAQYWVQNPDNFAANLVAQNVGNGVVKLSMPYDFAGQLWIIAGTAQFVKS
ncbi:phage tail sheath subtilisin-like domain-containing protein [Asaia spathodeae]|uniref:Phage tail sheath subtilisin-like domain-containing protein n=1 Tax=Asaia spathodeae TaxID=657016 RepID=A0ABX2P9A5_9PROT|nr:phage tail sheath subtilisin-like domain-containing protein [Asaia spathodeae]GBR21099.1 bacteriophage tail sheath protein [Asaia spathodeae NBRC 105894]